MTRARALAARAWAYRKRIRWRGLIPVILFGLSIVFSVNYYHREQASQQHQGQLLEHRLCITLNRLAALQPPPGDPGANPARGFDQQQHAVLAELGPDVGCPAVKP